MQINTLGSSDSRAFERSAARPAAGPAGSVAISPPLRPAGPGVLRRSEPTPSTDTPQAGVPVWNPERNGQLSSAQQGVQFLERLSTRLEELKSDLGRTVAGATLPVGRLERHREALNQLWNARSSQSGGRLDSRLVYSPNAPAAQGFAIHGLDAAAAQPAERETLAIALGTPTPTRPAALVVVEPGLGGKTLVSRFGQALAPLGISVTLTEQQGLRFAVPESEWPAVRDTLSIRGEGRLFPTGLFHRVRTEAEPAAIAPESWSLQAGPAGKQALQRIVQALDLAAEARGKAGAALRQASDDLDAAAAARDQSWAQNYADSFTAAARAATPTPGDSRTGQYEAAFALGAALPRINRQRVLNLLSLAR